MNEGYGAQSMTAPLRRVVMRRPGEAMAAADPAEWHYASAIDLEGARAAHDAFADATMLMSAAGQLQVSQVVDPLKTARFALPKSVIARLGRDLV